MEIEKATTRRFGSVIATYLAAAVLFLALGLTGAQARPRPAVPPPFEDSLRLWRFDYDGWWQSPYPLALDNIEAIESWSGYALKMAGDRPALLRYRDVEPSGHTNLTFATGTVRFWFAPNWTSASLGGKGPGAHGRFVEAGRWTQEATAGWWSLYLNPEGTAIYFSAQAGGAGADYLKADIDWRAGEWHLVTLAYTPKGTTLYLDGEPVADGAGVSLLPFARPLRNEKGIRPTDETARGSFTIGGDTEGGNLVQGLLDEFTTFDYPIGELELGWYYQGHAQRSRLGPLPSRDGHISIVKAILRPESDLTLARSSANGEATLAEGGLETPAAPGTGGAAMMMMGGGSGLWLEISLANATTARLTLHGTTPTTNYLILSRTHFDLNPANPGSASRHWVTEQSVFGADGTDVTETLVPLKGRTTLFFTAGSSEDSDGDGLPDAYEQLVLGTDPNNADTGNTGVSDGYQDSDSDGWTNLDEMRNQTSPDAWNTPAAPRGLALTEYAEADHASLIWEQGGNNIVNYQLLRSDNTQITFAPGSSTYQDNQVQALNPPSYSIRANYPQGPSAWSAWVSPIKPQYSFSGTIVRGPQGRVYIVTSGLPAGLQSIWLGGTFLELSAANFVNGIYQLSDADSWRLANSYLDGSTVIASDGFMGLADLGFFPDLSRYPGRDDIPFTFIDGTTALRDNISFLVRSATAVKLQSIFSTVHIFDPLYPSVYRRDSLGRDYEYSGYRTYLGNSTIATRMEFWPWFENAILRNYVLHDEDHADGRWETGVHYSPIVYYVRLENPRYEFLPSDYYNLPNPMPSLLDAQNSRWLLTTKRVGLGGNNLDIGLSYTDGYLHLAPASQNYFGLRFVSAALGADKWKPPLLPSQYPKVNAGESIPVNGSLYNHFFTETELPIMQTVTHYFSPADAIMPGHAGFNSASASLPIVGAVGQSVEVAGWAKQIVANGYNNRFAFREEYFDKAYKTDASGNATTTETGILSEYGEFFPTEPGLTILKTKYDPDQSASPGGPQGEAKVHVLKIQFDVNHDGTMDTSFTGPDNTIVTSHFGSYYTPDRPFVFWLNNDIDDGHVVDGNDFEEDDLRYSEITDPARRRLYDFNFNSLVSIPGGGPPTPLPSIPSKRDLEDYARLWIPGLSTLFPVLPSGYTVQMVISGDAEINLYHAVEPDGGTLYLTDETVAQNQVAQSLGLFAGRLTATTPITLTALGNQTGHFIFCGAKRGRSIITVRVNDATGIVITETRAAIEIKDIKEMYERWTVGDDGSKEPLPEAIPASEDLPTGVLQAFRYDNNGVNDATTPYILHVHGWNMERWEKDRYAETAYKRLYWQGYQGRFGSFRWPTRDKFGGNSAVENYFDAVVFPQHYDNSEFNAWKSASRLRDLLVTLNTRHPNQVHLLAHSMGNVVAGEALRLAGNSQVVNTYVASQAAIPAHVYDGAIAGAANLLNFTYNNPSIPDGFEPEVGAYGPATPNIYGNYLAGNSAAVGRRVNFFNPNDYALAPNAWQFNQVLKPDNAPFRASYRFHGTPHDGLARYTPGSVDDVPPYSSFGRYDLGSTVISYLAVNSDRYEIMAFAAEARSQAAGGLSVGAAFQQNLNLGDPNNEIWPPDTQEPLATQYRRHKWHSAQFRSNNMRQNGYWQALLDPRGFNLLGAP